MKRSKIVLLLIALVLVLAACGGTNTNTNENNNENNNANDVNNENNVNNESANNANEDSLGAEVAIGIAQLLEHPSLDSTREGFLAALADNGFVEGENLTVDYNSAQNDSSNNLTIAQRMASDSELDLVLAIATPTAQAVVQHVTDKPVLFAAITDPLATRLVEDMDRPGENVTGGADSNPEATRMLMDFIAAEFPEIETVGVVLNTGEPNAVVTIDIAEEALAEHDISVNRAAVSNSSEVRQAVDSLVGNVDAIFVALDNTVISGVNTIIQVAEKHKIPFFSSDRDTVEAGAIATYGFRYYDHGYQVGEMAVEILNGADPGEMPVSVPENLDLIINVEAAERQGVEITDSMKEQVQDKENILNE